MAMTLRLTPDDEQLLADLAAEQGLSRQEATVRAIREAAERRGHERTIRESSARYRQRYAELLARLGK
ncbi:MAG TPA: CopG family transcriptional regulator [Candidatus Agrococcus pullicola]|uniref:CopG family transcriptional regulator n=1 Tax=Candidatus Agrococcus pullicola TaxID=2838429 RepID=A0A9D2CAJ3_9MICO|nr:CopG family transcriptional regulator [Candidatus Agrococcus pullicola]